MTTPPATPVIEPKLHPRITSAPVANTHSAVTPRVESDVPSTYGPQPPPGDAPRVVRREAADIDPIVREAMQLFNAKVIDVQRKE